MNKLAMNTYEHNPVTAVGNVAVCNYKDDLTDYHVGADAKLIHTSSRILQTGGLASIFTGNQQQSDYILTNIDNVCHFENMSLRLNITNLDGTNPAILLPSQYLLNYFEVLMENGQVETVYNHNLFYDNLYLKGSDEELFNNQNLYSSVGGFNGVAYGSGVTIPASGSAIVYVDLPNIFTKCPIFIKALQKNIGIRCNWHPTGMYSTSLSSGIRVNDADMYISGVEYEQYVQSKLLTRYRSYDHMFGYYDPQRAIIPGQTLSATNKSNVKITEASGQYVSQLVVFIVPSGASGEAQFNFQPLLKLDLLRSGKTIGSFQDVNASWWKVQMAKLFGTSAVRTNNVYVIPFSKTPVESANYGIQRGAIYMSTNDILEMQASVAGTYDVYCLYYRFNAVTVFKNGNMSVDTVTN